MEEILLTVILTPVVLMLIYMGAFCMYYMADELRRFLVKLADKIERMGKHD